MSCVQKQRKSFFTNASLMLSSMLEDRVLDDKTQEEFVDWCESVYAGKDPYDIAAHVLAKFHERIQEDELHTRALYIVEKQLLSCNFAESFYNHIYFK